MGQFVKKFAFFGCVITGTCGVANAQSTWKWADRPVAEAERRGTLWERLPTQTPAAPALVGPSDFQFPPRDIGLIEPPIESAASEIPAERRNGHVWNRVIASGSAPSTATPQRNSQARQVRWEAIYGGGNAQETVSSASLATAVPAVEASPSDWDASYGSSLQDVARSTSELKMVGPMDQVAPTALVDSQFSTAIAMPSQNPTDTSSLIVDSIFPEPGTEAVTPIELGVVASQSKTSSAQVANDPLSQLQTAPVNLLNMQGVRAPEKSSQADAPMAEVVSGESSEKPGSYVLQSVKGGAHKQPPETIVPIDIIPFNRLVTSQSQTEGLSRTYTAAAMTGPLKDPGALFSKLHIEDDYRQQPFVSVGAIRTSTDPFSAGAEWMQHDYAWVTPTFYHRPLYFEQPNVERYGIGTKRWIQPFHSAAHFFGSIGLMPYKLTTQHPGEHVYTLGHGRPGDCVNVQRKTLLGQSYPMEALRYFDDYSGYH